MKGRYDEVKKIIEFAERFVGRELGAAKMFFTGRKENWKGDCYHEEGNMFS